MPSSVSGAMSHLDSPVVTRTIRRFRRAAAENRASVRSGFALAPIGPAPIRPDL